MATVKSIADKAPPRTAPAAERAAYEAALAGVLGHALLSIAMLSGELAFHLRRQSAAEAVEASLARAN